jgi:hypothetical protein
MSENITNVWKRTAGFKFTDEEHSILQQYVDIFSQQKIRS